MNRLCFLLGSLFLAVTASTAAAAPPTKVVTGLNTTCAIYSTGGLYCWGDNSFGQLGQGAVSAPIPTPTFVASNVIDVSVAPNDENVCFVLDYSAIPSGGAKCMGHNDRGQLGDGTTTDRYVPTLVVGSPNASFPFVSIGIGGKHACALNNPGTNHGIYCWGDNQHGQIGQGVVNTTIYGLTLPVGWSPSTPVLSMSVGEDYTCANVNNSSNNEIMCWGKNNVGQLGRGGPNTDIALWWDPFTNHGFLSSNAQPDLSIAAGRDHTCAVLGGTASGQAYCWGNNADGEIGNAVNGGTYNTPQAVAGTGNALVAAGGVHTCAAASSGTNVRCWGNGQHGQLDTAGPVSTPTPQAIQSFHMPATSISLGALTTCFINNGGLPSAVIVCVGSNASGQVGNGSTGGDVFATKCGDGVVDVATWGETCDDGNTTSGDGCSSTCQVEPNYACTGAPSSCAASSPPSGSSPPLKSAAGSSNTCRISSAGGLWCWGDNSNGQLDNTFLSKQVPFAIPGMSSGVTDVSVSGDGYTICAIKSGSLYCWGDNAFGQIGDGTTTDRSAPTKVPGLANVQRVAESGNHTCALVLAPSNELAEYCWGDNTEGQLGLGTYGGTHTSPTQVFSTGIRDIAANRSTTCDTDSGNSVRCWGKNDWGQLAQAIAITHTNTRGSVIHGGTHVTMGWNHVCSEYSGVVKCWGANDNGQVGFGDCGSYTPCSGGTPYFTTPKQVNSYYPVTGTAIPYTSVSAGGSSTCAVRADTNQLACWGYGGTGMMSHGNATPNGCEYRTGTGLSRVLHEDCNKSSPTLLGLTAGGVGVPNATSVATGGIHVTAYYSTPNSVFSWGDNGMYTLGNNTTTRLYYADGTPATSVPSGGW